MDWYFQLFSARNTPLGKALRLIAEAGYRGVEAYQANLDDAAAFETGLKDTGLTVPSLHIGLDALREDMTSCIDTAHRYGSVQIVCPYLMPESRPSSRVAWLQLAEEIAALAQSVQDSDLVFAWHNHDFEFQALDDGTVPMQILLDTADDIAWEIDVAWIVKAGADPAPWVQQYASRISAVHLKDLATPGDCLDEDGWADFGQGIVPWSTLLPLLSESSAEFYAVEHDNPSDLERFAKTAIANANAFRSATLSL